MVFLQPDKPTTCGSCRAEWLAHLERRRTPTYSDEEECANTPASGPVHPHHPGGRAPRARRSRRASSLSGRMAPLSHKRLQHPDALRRARRGPAARRFGGKKRGKRWEVRERQIPTAIERGRLRVQLSNVLEGSSFIGRIILSCDRRNICAPLCAE